MHTGYFGHHRDNGGPRRARHVTISVVRATIIGAAGLVLGPLIDVLGRAGVSEVFVLASAIGDSHLFEPTPDIVVGVLNPLAGESPGQGLTNLDVMLRAGRSAERNLPTLLIIPPPIASLSPSASVAFAYCAVNNTAALDFHISAFVATASAEGREYASASPERRDETLFEIAARLGDRPELSGPEFESLIRTVLENDREAPALLSQAMNAKDVGFDLVVAPAEAPDTIILVQAKIGSVNEEWLSRSEDSLQHMVVINRARMGLLVYYDREGREFGTRSITPLVVSLSLKSLTEQLATRSLAEVLNDAAARRLGGATS